MGEPLLVGVPSDATITGSKLASNIGISTTGNIATTGSGTLSVAGALSAKGGAVFNEDSADVDFRVEGNGNTHLIHADAGSDRVGINTGATDLSAGNYGVLNVGGDVANAGHLQWK